MNKERLEEIREANKARTPGKWFWFAYKANKNICLDTWGNDSRRYDTVMSFKRWGMSGAQPVFYDEGKHETVPASEIFEYGKEQSCNPIVTGIKSPDARFIAKAPEYVTELLELADQQTAEIDRLKAVIGAAAGENFVANFLEIEGVPV